MKLHNLIATYCALSATGAAAWSHIRVAELEQRLGESPALVAFVTDSSDQRSRELETQWAVAVAQVTTPAYSIDCSIDSDFCGGLEGLVLPGVVYFASRREPHVYRGPRSAVELQIFADRMRRAAVLRIEPGGDESLTTQDDVVCLANAGSHDVEFIDSFHAVARSLHGELTFGLALRDTDDNLNVKSTIECRRQRDDKTKVYTHDGTGGEDIKAWILEATRPTIADLTPYNHQRLLDRRWPMIYVFGNSLQQRQDLREKLSSFAKSYPDLTTVLVDPLDFPDLPQRLGLETDKFPAGAVHQLTTDRVWPYPHGKDLSSGNLQQFGLDVWQGKIKPWTPPGKPLPKEDARARLNKHIKVANIPGLRLKIAGHDEL